jgi:formylglycine-generating enzyme required for sulfatase activity
MRFSTETCLRSTTSRILSDISIAHSSSTRIGRARLLRDRQFAAPKRRSERRGGFPNPRGLYQVHGNAFEWVEDCWNEGYRNAPAGDVASLTGNCSRHVRRGGAWNFIPATLRSAYRDSRPAITRGSNTSFRVVRALNQILSAGRLM